MTCPPEIAAIVAEILKEGILRIRALGWSANAERCAIEADHLHNLPTLLVSYTQDLLGYYWRVERVSFIERSSKDDVAVFEAAWARLATHLTPETRVYPKPLRPAI